MKFIIVLFAVAVASSSVAVAAPQLDGLLSGILGGSTGGSTDGSTGGLNYTGLIGTLDITQIGPNVQQLLVDLAEALEQLSRAQTPDAILSAANGAKQIIKVLRKVLPGLKPLYDLLEKIIDAIIANPTKENVKVPEALIQSILDELLTPLLKNLFKLNGTEPSSVV